MGQSANDEIRAAVRDTYSRAALGVNDSCCSSSSDEASTSSCCGASGPTAVDSTRLGYSVHDLAAVPEGSDLGLGCGNPGAIAALQSGEVVLDLGSGAGFDAFLASSAVGDAGRVIGVDMTPAMLSKARSNAENAGYANVEFRLGEIENLPVADASVNVIISNCVINLSPDKPAVFRESFRVLAPGGRLAISDVVASAELPEEMRNDLTLYSGCMAGASLVSDLERMLVSEYIPTCRSEYTSTCRSTRTSYQVLGSPPFTPSRSFSR